MFFLLFVVLLACPLGYAEDSSSLPVSTLNLDLQNELLEKVELEQTLRQQWINAVAQETKDSFRQKIIELDALNVVFIKKIVYEYGWPGYTLVGSVGSHAFWLLVQHTPDINFQSYCLELLEKAVAAGDASPIDLAFLTDRVYMHAGKKQIYGTQVNEDLTLYPIENEENVDERRAALGLCPLEEYLRIINELYSKN